MLLAFNASMAMLISVTATLFAGIVVIFNNDNLAVPELHSLSFRA